MSSHSIKPPLQDAGARTADGKTNANAASSGQRGDADFRAQLAGFSLTTAEILYRMPDHPALIQTYVWQDYDAAPRFPRLTAFLEFWMAKLEGPLFRVTVASTALIRPAELKLVGAEFRLH